MQGFLLSMATIICLLGAFDAKAGLLDDIKDAVVGHSKDIVGRFADDQVLEDAEILKTGQFRSDDPGNDAAHHGEGLVSLVTKDNGHYIQFHPNFAAAFAPDPMIYVSSAARIVDKDSFFASERQNLGPLTKGSGASFVKVEGFDGSRIESVTIWCERFGAFITSASLE